MKTGLGSPAVFCLLTALTVVALSYTSTGSAGAGTDQSADPSVSQPRIDDPHPCDECFEDDDDHRFAFSTECNSGDPECVCWDYPELCRICDDDTYIGESGECHPAWYLGGCHGPCDVGEEANVDMPALLAAVADADVEAVQHAVQAFPKALHLNRDRSAIQLVNCRGLTYAHIPLQSELLGALNIGSP